MPKVYTVSKKDCEVNLTTFYENAAKASGYFVTDQTKFDCRKIHVTATALKALFVFYLTLGLTDEETGSLMVQFGPKADLAGMRYQFAIEEGFATEAV